MDEIEAFIKAAGVHIYTDSRDVVYASSGYIALHAATGGKKKIKLPRTTKITAIFGADISEQITDIIEFELGKHETALFKMN